MFPPAFAAIQHESVVTVTLELPASHSVPVSWIRQFGSPAIRWRTVRDVLPEGSATPEDIGALREELLAQKNVSQVLKKQKPDGVWAGNILGVAPSKAQGIRDVGTVAQYQIGRAHV